jgi:hypothetical protein
MTHYTDLQWIELGIGLMVPALYSIAFSLIALVREVRK